MENQNQVLPQTQPSVSQVNISPIQPLSPEQKNKGKIWKIVSIISISIIVIFSLLVWYGSRLEKQDKNLSNNSQNNNMNILTAEKIKNFKTSSNDPEGDYFIGSPEEQKNIVGAFVTDNSNSDPTYLYIAANTAYRIGEIKEAGFLFYAAQIRKGFDYKRYGLGNADGNNIQTYWGFLNETTGASINPSIMRNPQEFSEVIDMIVKWQVVPADDALYPKESYGSYAVPKDQWSALAEQVKQGFVDNFGNKFIKLLSDPKNVEAFNFVQDYNLGKIPHNSENDKKYQEYMIVVKKGLE
jgi:hypothetical protein